ncbi:MULTISPECIES: urease accessory protein UreD [Sphingobacterium]|uniref:Urease accessory protein UreD n=1 Tax=Sphingobacterium kitahiroshimense TaxID=470446 RepID=A0ABV0BQY4_9SPHI|nr:MULTISPECIES: urease accessory protein UreD [Sphingobacterium]MCS3553511.1 urease accessory protein [Sphingobacterium sp. JUb21]MCW2262199.1 urease accessory protein [Sphingobacterium kitahiroshimense]TCR09279.1 urease accessory protein [Sphingobacterium sp. JUb20]TCR13053.1 urease accessory protein [Sphingobacterium sp. JUb78]
MESVIQLNVAKEGTYSVLKESCHNAPYKLTHYGAPKLQEHLEMIIMSASPGIMDDDTLDIEINMKADTQLKLFTQSFNKLHPMKRGARQTTVARIAHDAVFHYIPHPVTPFKDSIFKNENSVYLEGNAVLIWADVVGAGRIHMNEAFLFNSLHSTTKIYRNNKLILMDNQFLSPAKQPITGLLFFEGYTHQATFIFSALFAKELKEELDEIMTLDYSDITYGFTKAADDIVMLRALGNDGELLYDFMGMLGQLCWDFTQHIKEESRLAGIAEDQLEESTKEVAPVPVVKEVKKRPALKKTNAVKARPKTKKKEVVDA